MENDIYILGIESSCDDTSAAVLKNGVLLSNVTASQAVHEAYGGVVPELASRAHQQNVVPVVDQAIKKRRNHQGTIDGHRLYPWTGSDGLVARWSEFCKGFCQESGDSPYRRESPARTCDGAFHP